MNERIRILGVTLSLLLAAHIIEAQRATELFIPIGASPNLSDRHTVIGTIENVDVEALTVTVRGESDSNLHTGSITDETQIFLDKSSIRESNTYGTFSDFVDGARVEMLYFGEEHDTEGAVRWIKIEISSEP